LKIMANTNRLTATQVDPLPPGLHADGNGLYLSVKESGARSWMFRYRFAGREREAGLGKAGKGNVSLKDARQRAAEGRAYLNAKPQIDPLTIWRKAPEASAATFAECALKFLDRQEARGLLGKNPRHVGQWRSTLASLPQWFQKTPIDQIGPEAVFNALDPIWTLKPETASRVRGRIAAVLDSARGPDDIRVNPAAWSGWLKMKLGSPKLLGKIDRSSGERVDRNHFRALPYKDMPALIARLRDDGSVPASGLEFIVLTASRSKEVRFAKWDEVDIDARTWTIPWQRLKTGRKTKTDHVVPLSDRALAIIAEMSKIRVSDYVFPGRADNAPLGEMAFFDLLRRRIKIDTSTHGLRSSFRDWCGDATNYPRELAELALNHKIGDAAELAYRRGSAVEKRAALMGSWADFCEPRPEDGVGNVVRLKQRRRSSRAAI
jgi:integrase